MYWAKAQNLAIFFENSFPGVFFTSYLLQLCYTIAVDNHSTDRHTIDCSSSPSATLVLVLADILAFDIIAITYDSRVCLQERCC